MFKRYRITKKLVWHHISGETALGLLSLFLLFFGCSDASLKTNSEPEELPQESVYHLQGKWDNQEGDSLNLSQFRGKIPVVAMIFTRCAYACPRIVADLKNIEQQVPKDKKDKVVFVLVSFDSERDNSSSLKQFASQMKLDEKWNLLRGDADQVRELSMLLNVKYKRQPDGNFTHSNGITLLDTNGLITRQLEGLGGNPEPLVSKLKAL